MLHLLSAVAVYLYFKEKEPVDVPTVATLLVVVPALSISLRNYFNLVSPICGIASCIPSFFAFYALLLSCMMAYRLSSLHPLSRYPGPLLCKISKLWIIYLAYRGKLHLYYKSLHDTYGPIVRVGPNDLSINEKKLIPFILGTRGMPKGPIWDARRNRQLGKDREYHAVIDVRDLKVHAQLRRRWNEAFSSEPLKDYQETLTKRTQELCDHLEALCKDEAGGVATVDLAKWISFFAFDFMGDMAFGGGFELMRDQDAQGIWKSMEKGLTNQSIIQHALWVAVMFQSIPFFSTGMRQFARFAMDKAKCRSQTPAKTKDLFYHLYESHGDPANPSSYEAQVSEAITDSTLIIIAGSDTSASVISSVMSLLLRHPQAHRRLIEELDEAFPAMDCDDRRIIEVEKLQNLHYLNAVMSVSSLLARLHFSLSSSFLLSRIIAEPELTFSLLVTLETRPCVYFRLFHPRFSAVHRREAEGKCSEMICTCAEAVSFPLCALTRDLLFTSFQSAHRFPIFLVAARAATRVHSFIPEGTGVIVPPYCLHRDPRYFSPYPDSFIPDRWLPPSSPSPSTSSTASSAQDLKSELLHPQPIFRTDREAFIPFSYGPANCAGKPLALLEVRYVIAHLVTRFDYFQSSQDSDGSSAGEGQERKWEDEMEDRFVFTKGALHVGVCLKPFASQSIPLQS